MRVDATFKDVDIEFHSNIVNDAKYAIRQEYPEKAIECEIDEVPYAAIALFKSLMQIQGQ